MYRSVMPERRPTRLILLTALIIVGAGLIWMGLQQRERVAAEAATPMDIEWADGFAYASVAEGRILRLTVEGDAVVTETVAEGLAYPRGIALVGDRLYVAELGELPCQNPIPRCKGEQVGSDPIEGERRILEESAGRILAFPVEDGQVGEPSVLVDGLSFVNADHGLNDLDLGPDGMLYLSVGNLDRLAWQDVDEPPAGELVERLGTILRIDPTSGDVQVYARGLRNVFGLTFDDDGRLWGVDNDGPGRGPWRFEELLQIQEDLDYGFPEDGTVGPYERRTGFATWIMPVGAGSSGIVVNGSVVISGGCGMVTRVDLVSTTGDAVIDEVDYGGCLTAVEPMPDGRLLLGTVLGAEPFRVSTEAELFGE